MHAPVDPATAPIDPATAPEFLRAHRSVWKRRLAGWLLARSGWRLTGAFPRERRLILVAAPHTSNWDFVVGVLAMLAYDLDVNWLGKHSLFHWPLGPLMRRLGGVPVNRRSPEGVAEQVARRMGDADHMWLAITPEGTRKAVDRWKTGFLRIAAAADCPLVLVSLDFARRELRLGDELMPDPADPDGQLAAIRRYYRDVTPRHPGNFIAAERCIDPSSGKRT